MPAQWASWVGAGKPQCGRGARALQPGAEPTRPPAPACHGHWLQSKINETKDLMKKKALEIEKSKMEAAKGGKSSEQGLGDKSGGGAGLRSWDKRQVERAGGGAGLHTWGKVDGGLQLSDSWRMGGVAPL